MKTLNYIYKLFWRLLSAPFVIVVFILFNAAMAIKAFIFWILYGGEILAYASDTKPAVARIYSELKKQNELSEKLLKLSKENEELRNS